jgi:hypothetical protein
MSHLAVHAGCVSNVTVAGSGCIRCEPQLQGSFNHAQPPVNPIRAAANAYIPIRLFMMSMFDR